MPLFDIIVLSAIVAVFTTFGVVLAFLTWYCRPGHIKAKQGARHYPTTPGLITDDD